MKTTGCMARSSGTSAPRSPRRCYAIAEFGLGRSGSGNHSCPFAGMTRIRFKGFFAVAA
jgi:hypothetical protein